ncbi:MAG: zinc-ribbon domain-containing protein [Erysipelothrix sp.]|nr:zinc-ribbon domain-containing protein [Erysipelothrix sp.]
MKPCPQCNHLLEDDMRFCPRCGHEIVESKRPVISSTPVKYNSTPYYPVQKIKKKKSGGLLVVLLLVILASTMIGLLKTVGSKTPTKIAEPTVTTTKPLASAITLDKSKLDLQPGKSQQLDFTLTPRSASEDEISWQTSNSSVVKIENGLVTAVGPGKATITVLARKGIVDTCEITVRFIDPSFIKFSDSSSSYIYVNKPLKIDLDADFDVTPANADLHDLVWISSNEQVATVDGGLVQGLQNGNVTITVKTENGVEASKEYIVSAVEPESVTLNCETLELIEGSTYQLYATVEPYNAGTELIYSGVNVDENGLITAKQSGTSKVTVSTSNGKSFTCELTVKKQSPITIVNMRYTIDFVGGVEWTFYLRNNTDKEIKYIFLAWDCYNGVDDLIKDEITGKTSVSLKYTGPLAPWATTTLLNNSNKFYNSTYKKSIYTLIEVEYMDGKTEKINSNDYVGWVE